MAESPDESNWQHALAPQLVQRLTRPIRQAGVVSSQLAETVLARAQSPAGRLPLLDAWHQRWDNSEQSLTDQTPIVYARPQSAELSTPAPAAPSSRPIVQASRVTPSAPSSGAIVQRMPLDQSSASNEVIGQPSIVQDVGTLGASTPAPVQRAVVSAPATPIVQAARDPLVPSAAQPAQADPRALRAARLPRLPDAPTPAHPAQLARAIDRAVAPDAPRSTVTPSAANDAAGSTVIQRQVDSPLPFHHASEAAPANLTGASHHLESLVSQPLPQPARPSGQAAVQRQADDALRPVVQPLPKTLQMQRAPLSTSTVVQRQSDESLATSAVVQQMPLVTPAPRQEVDHALPLITRPMSPGVRTGQTSAPNLNVTGPGVAASAPATVQRAVERPRVVVQRSVDRAYTPLTLPAARAGVPVESGNGHTAVVQRMPLPEANSAPGPFSAKTQAPVVVQRAPDHGSPVIQRQAGMRSDDSNVDELADRVERRLLRQLAIENERRGWQQWV